MVNSHATVKKNRGMTFTNFSKLGFNSIQSKDFQMFKLVLEKSEEPEIKLPTSVGS